MSTPEETLLLLEHRYVCSECSHLSPSLEEALLHHQQHLQPPEPAQTPPQIPAAPLPAQCEPPAPPGRAPGRGPQPVPVPGVRRAAPHARAAAGAPGAAPEAFGDPRGAPETLPEFLRRPPPRAPPQIFGDAPKPSQNSSGVHQELHLKFLGDAPKTVPEFFGRPPRAPPQIFGRPPKTLRKLVLHPFRVPRVPGVVPEPGPVAGAHRQSHRNAPQFTPNHGQGGPGALVPQAQRRERRDLRRDRRRDPGRRRRLHPALALRVRGVSPTLPKPQRLSGAPGDAPGAPRRRRRRRRSRGATTAGSCCRRRGCCARTCAATPWAPSSARCARGCCRTRPSCAGTCAAHAGDSLFLCLDCGLALDTEAALLAHRRGHGVAEPLHRCACGKTFTNMTKFLYHRRSHAVPSSIPIPEPVLDQPEVSLECGMCQKRFPSAAALARHQRFVHRLERRHRCGTCGKMFKKSSHLRNHARTHTGERPLPVPGVRQNLQLPREPDPAQPNPHRGAPPRVPRVPQTLRPELHAEAAPAAAPAALPAPLRRLRAALPAAAPGCCCNRAHHSGEFPYKCPQCGRSFLLRRLLDVHLLGHSGRQPMRCEGCGAASHTAAALREHRCGHAGWKLECGTCGKKCSTAARLRAHERTHGVGEDGQMLGEGRNPRWRRRPIRVRSPKWRRNPIWRRNPTWRQHLRRFRNPKWRRSPKWLPPPFWSPECPPADFL
ncbi:uncharacterized protein VK521_015402 [Ammospiza maritima maritima]